MSASACHIFRVDRPHLHGEIDPLLLRESTLLLYFFTQERRLSFLHIDVYELYCVILIDVGWVRIAAKHLLARLLLPDEQAEEVQ